MIKVRLGKVDLTSCYYYTTKVEICQGGKENFTKKILACKQFGKRVDFWQKNTAQVFRDSLCGNVTLRRLRLWQSFHR